MVDILLQQRRQPQRGVGRAQYQRLQPRQVTHQRQPVAARLPREARLGQQRQLQPLRVQRVQRLPAASACGASWLSA